MFFNKFKTSALRAIILINLTYFKMDHGHRRNELPSMEMVKATQLTLGAMCMIEPVDNDACCAFVCCPPIGTKCKRIYGDSLIPPGLQNYMDQTEFESMCDDIDKAYASTSAPILPCVMLHFPGVIYLLCLISSRKNKMNEIVNRVNALPALTRNGMSWKATACGPDTDSSNCVNPMCQYIFTTLGKFCCEDSTAADVRNASSNGNYATSTRCTTAAGWNSDGTCAHNGIFISACPCIWNRCTYCACF